MLVIVRKVNIVSDGEEKKEEKRQEFSITTVSGRDDKGLFKFYYFLLFLSFEYKRI